MIEEALFLESPLLSRVIQQARGTRCSTWRVTLTSTSHSFDWHALPPVRLEPLFLHHRCTPYVIVA